MDDILKDLDETVAALDADLAPLRAVDAPRPGVVKRLGNGIVKGAQRAAEETASMARFIRDRLKPLGQMVKTNAFDPLKAAKHYVPKKLRSKSGVFDVFMLEKSKIGAKHPIATARLARSCAKAGLTIADDLMER